MADASESNLTWQVIEAARFGSRLAALPTPRSQAHSLFLQGQEQKSTHCNLVKLTTLPMSSQIPLIACAWDPSSRCPISGHHASENSSKVNVVARLERLLPLSAYHTRIALPPILILIQDVATHMFMVGLPISLVVRKFSTSSSFSGGLIHG